MAAFIPKSPALPRFARGETGRLAKALFTSLSEIALRLNGALPKDGTEGMGYPLPLKASTVAGLSVYPAADWTGALLYVSDGTGNKRLAISDGTSWRFPDGNVVS